MYIASVNTVLSTKSTQNNNMDFCFVKLDKAVNDPLINEKPPVNANTTHEKMLSTVIDCVL